MSEPSLLRDAAVYLGAAVVFVPLAARAKLGSILGYLVAGCVIGPWGAGLVSDVQSILHFAEFGVVLMLFLIGLELDVSHVWAMRRALFGAGAAQVGAVGAAIGIAALALGLPWQAALVGGAALALSSTAIAVQTLRERNLTERPLGRTSFAILLFQDIAAIPLLAIVPLLAASAAARAANAAPEQPFWVGAARALGAVVLVVVVGRYLTRPLLRWIAELHLREVFTAFALFLVVGIAQLMDLAGLSMALGAFLAGVLLASTEYRRALETDLEPFKGLLLGLFFLAVGMSIDFGLLGARPGLVALLVVGFLAVKGGVMAALAPVLGVEARERWLFAALLGQGSEFAFVVFGLAGAAGVLPDPWGPTLTLVVALSMALTPVLLLLSDRVQRARQLEVKREYDRIEPTPGGQVIIAGFGRFGQVVGRFLFANGVRATVLEHDPTQIDLLRKFGFRVFYGDATRLDLLETAGAREARLLVVAVDGVDDSLELVDAVREHFPGLEIVARARNVMHWYELRRRGVEIVERETFDSALRLGRRAVERLGGTPYEVHAAAARFRRHNVELLESMWRHVADEPTRISMARAAREQLEQQFERDRRDAARSSALGWHTDPEPAEDAARGERRESPARTD